MDCVGPLSWSPSAADGRHRTPPQRLEGANGRSAREDKQTRCGQWCARSLYIIILIVDTAYMTALLELSAQIACCVIAPVIGYSTGVDLTMYGFTLHVGEITGRYFRRDNPCTVWNIYRYAFFSVIRILLTVIRIWYAYQKRWYIYHLTSSIRMGVHIAQRCETHTAFALAIWRSSLLYTYENVCTCTVHICTWYRTAV